MTDEKMIKKYKKYHRILKTSKNKKEIEEAKFVLAVLMIRINSRWSDREHLGLPHKFDEIKDIFPVDLK